MGNLKIRSRGWLLLGLAALAAGSVAFAACGDDDDETTPTAPSTGTAATGTAATATATADNRIDYGSLSGQIRVDGSSTVFPISEAVAEEFSKVSRVRVNVAFSGTGGGFEKFCRGETQISNASRPIRQKELDACAANGISDVVEIKVAIDALTVVVNPNNDWAKCMTVDQLHKAFKNGGATSWSDLDPAWPNSRIIFYYPGADSGTFDYFNEAIIAGGAPQGEKASHRSDGTASEDDNILVQGVEGDRNAIGYFGFAYFQEAGQKLHAVAVDGGEGCVEPTFDNATTGKYKPLSRPLFIYTTESLLKERPEVLGFVKFYIENMVELSADVGYVSLPAAEVAAQMAKVEPFLP